MQLELDPSKQSKVISYLLPGVSINANAVISLRPADLYIRCHNPIMQQSSDTAISELQISGGIEDWLVGCFELNGPLRQYFNLYRASSQREGERREMIDQRKNVQTTPTRTHCKRSRPLPYSNPN